MLSGCGYANRESVTGLAQGSVGKSGAPAPNSASGVAGGTRGAGCVSLAPSTRGRTIMPITGQGWEIHVQRVKEQSRGKAVRTVGTYQVFHNGVPAGSVAVG